MSIEIIKEMYCYDPNTGKLSWNTQRPDSHFKRSTERTKYFKYLSGQDVKQTINFYGYLVVGVGKRIYPTHRLAFIIMLGRFPDGVVDHIDGNPLNNKWDNLREVSQALNSRNSRKDHRNKSGYAGVYWVKRDKHWKSQVFVDGKSKHLGAFSSPEEANLARLNYLNTRSDLGYTERHGQ